MGEAGYENMFGGRLRIHLFDGCFANEHCPKHIQDCPNVLPDVFGIDVAGWLLAGLAVGWLAFEVFRGFESG